MTSTREHKAGKNQTGKDAQECTASAPNQPLPRRGCWSKRARPRVMHYGHPCGTPLSDPTFRLLPASVRLHQ